VVTNARAYYTTRAAAGALDTRLSLRPLLSLGEWFANNSGAHRAARARSHAPGPAFAEQFSCCDAKGKAAFVPMKQAAVCKGPMLLSKRPGRHRKRPGAHRTLRQRSIRRYRDLPLDKIPRFRQNIGKDRRTRSGGERRQRSPAALLRNLRWA
jgi:hypothetical protein